MAKRLDKTSILLNHIVNVIQETKGKEIMSLDLTKIDSAICKYFVICTGTSSLHVKSIENKIKKTISQDIGEKPWHTEGNNVGEWILMDYYDIIVHIFKTEDRNYYNLERLWADAPINEYHNEDFKASNK